MHDNPNDESVMVSERKFNAVCTLEISGTEEKRKVKWAARMFFKEQYGHDPSKIVAEKQELALNEHCWEVMVAQHSSGSLKGSESYEL